MRTLVRAFRRFQGNDCLIYSSTHMFGLVEFQGTPAQIGFLAIALNPAFRRLP